MDVAKLIDQLQEAYRVRDEELRTVFQRSLSFGDGLFDRWERARRLGFGDEASIYNSSLVYGEVTVGAHTWIGPYTLLDGSSAALSIGEWCSVSTGVHVYTHDTVLWALSGGHLGKRTGPVTIGDRCHLGSQSVILPSVTIGSQVVVAANSVVRHDVPDRTIVAGSPANAIGRVEGDDDDVRLVIPGSAE